jgi:hypothetical protein
VGGECSTFGEKITACGFWWGKFNEKKRPFGRLRARWEDNIKLDVKETVNVRV